MTPIASPRIPEPRLVKVENLTPFAHFHCQKMGAGRLFFDVLVVKGTFDLAPGALSISGEQAPIVLADQVWNTDGASRSSLCRAGEVHLAKPGTDVLVTGTARSPLGRAAAGWDCAVVVRGPRGTSLRHAVQVTGPRRWVHRALRGWVLSEAEPAVEVPIRYELAYGGSYLGPKGWVVHRPNPSGSGVFDEGRLDTSRTYTAPQWQLSTHPVTSMNSDVPVAGLGPIARMWSPRLRYAGTYDRAWEERMRADAASGLMPDYAPDFDPRFFHCAPPALFTREPLRGDEHVGLTGLVAESRDFVFQLPDVRPRARVLSAGGPWEDQAMALDTVHVDLDARRVHLCWRLALADPGAACAAVVVLDRGQEHAQAHR